jgi:two-component system, NtrC family, response regulator AtoC
MLKGERVELNTTSYLPAGRDAPVERRESAMPELYELLARVAPTPISVLVLGETGVGKEVTAEWVHARSQRSQQKLVKINCAGLTDSLVESELFGHERGAFTGAVAAHAGLFDAAHRGTLFLDEIGELPLRTQAKLLRVLEAGEFARVGSSQLRQVDVRIVAATHRNLQHMIELGQFRADLFFRLAGITVRIPALRERRGEISTLTRQFLSGCARREGRTELALSDGAMRALERHTWPGNIRELRNTIERAAVLCTGPVIEADLLVLGAAHGANGPVPHERDGPVAMLPEPGVWTRPLGDARASDIRTNLRMFERDQIVGALRVAHGNQTEAAKLLGISRRTLTNKLNAHDLERPRKRRPPNAS